MNDPAYIQGLEGAAPYDESESLNEGAPAGPHSLECEMALLGALLINNDVYTGVAAFLTPEHFWEPIHGQIYQVACQCIEQGQPINPISIHHHFAEHKGLKELGGMAYFAHLAASCPAIIAAVGYARIIAELAGRRRVIDVTEHIRKRASGSEVGPVDDIISEGIDLIANGSGLGDRIKRTRASFGEKVSTMVESANQAYMDGGVALSSRVVTTGSAALDRKIGGWRRKQYYVIGARPGMGKTTFAMSSLLRTAKGGGGVLVYSLEMGSEALVERSMSDLIYDPDRPITYESIARRELDASVIERLIDAEREYQDLPIVIEEKAGLTVPQMRVIAQDVAQHMAEKGQRLDVVLIDHIGKVKASGNYKGNKVAETGEVSNALAEMAKDLDVAVIGLCQLSRQVEGRDDKRPTLADLRWAGEIEQDADVIIFLYREVYYLERERGGSPDQALARSDRLSAVRHELEVDVAKQRGGSTGALMLWTDVSCAAVRDMAPAVRAKGTGQSERFARAVGAGRR